MSVLPCVEKLSNNERDPDAAVIWLHGLGADGHDLAGIVPQLRLPASMSLRFVFPHAPSIPVTINNGHVMPAWYDILEMDVQRRVDEAQLRESASAVDRLVEYELERGIPVQRIVLAGFSQGGAVVYEAGLRSRRALAGIMALSTYFATASSLEPAADRSLPLLVCHGDQDPVIPEEYGRRSVESLQAMGYDPDYRVYSMPHAICQQEIEDISAWLERILAY